MEGPGCRSIRPAAHFASGLLNGESPVSDIAYVGPYIGSRLNARGIHTVQDLVEYFSGDHDQEWIQETLGNLVRNARSNRCDAQDDYHVSDNNQCGYNYLLDVLKYAAANWDDAAIPAVENVPYRRRGTDQARRCSCKRTQAQCAGMGCSWKRHADYGAACVPRAGEQGFQGRSVNMETYGQRDTEHTTPGNSMDNTPAGRYIARWRVPANGVRRRRAARAQRRRRRSRRLRGQVPLYGGAFTVSELKEDDGRLYALIGDNTPHFFKKPPHIDRMVAHLRMDGATRRSEGRGRQAQRDGTNPNPNWKPAVDYYMWVKDGNKLRRAANETYSLKIYNKLIRKAGFEELPKEAYKNKQHDEGDQSDWTDEEDGDLFKPKQFDDAWGVPIYDFRDEYDEDFWSTYLSEKMYENKRRQGIIIIEKLIAAENAAAAPAAEDEDAAPAAEDEDAAPAAEDEDAAAENAGDDDFDKIQRVRVDSDDESDDEEDEIDEGFGQMEKLLLDNKFGAGGVETIKQRIREIERSSGRQEKLRKLFNQMLRE